MENKPNVAEMEAIIGYIEAHPEEWDQQLWATKLDCGTAYCMAGHAVVRAGYSIRWEDSLDGRRVGNTCVDPVNGQVWSIETLARSLLGLTPTEALYLFAASNDLDDLKITVKKIANGENATWTRSDEEDDF